MATPQEPDAAAEDGYVVTIGTYDGVHLGHQQLISDTRAEATLAGLRSAVVTFDRHPAETIRPAAAPQLLTGLEHKIELLEQTGIDRIIVLAFDEARAAQSAEDFVEQLLVNEIGARAVVVGANFRFGHRQRGDIALLETLGDRLALRVHAVELIRGNTEHVPVSSAGIRAHISRGDLDEARRLLGRPHEVRGELASIDGAARVTLSPRLLLPPAGRYHALFGPPSLPETPTVVTVRAECTNLLLDVAVSGIAGERVAVRFLDAVVGSTS